jgi:type II secretory ATPase GspE/PulE/Tfp pilus assembly ATPase PilB-like protein
MYGLLIALASAELHFADSYAVRVSFVSKVTLIMRHLPQNGSITSHVSKRTEMDDASMYHTGRKHSDIEP